MEDIYMHQELLNLIKLTLNKYLWDESKFKLNIFCNTFIFLIESIMINVKINNLLCSMCIYTCFYNMLFLKIWKTEIFVYNNCKYIKNFKEYIICSKLGNLIYTYTIAAKLKYIEHTKK